MFYANAIQIVFRYFGSGDESRVNASYKAYPRGSMPPAQDLPFFSTEPTESSFTYQCEGIPDLPEAITCDGIRHCEGGEDEDGCAYRDEGCGDWYPHSDQCLKAVFFNAFTYPLTATTPWAAEEACSQRQGATLAAFADTPGQQALADMIARSGFPTAVVGARRVQPVWPALSHLYRFVWQWGKRGSPIAYEQQWLQRDAGHRSCAKLSIFPVPSLPSVDCAFQTDLTSGYICMRPNPLRQKRKLALPGAALPAATSPPDAFPTKPCPDGSLVHTFLSCQWGREGEGKAELAAGLSPNNLALFQCRYGQSVHHSLLCDGKDDCADRRDEADCRQPRFSPLLDSSFICANFQAVPKDRRCNGMRDCFDGSDEDSCVVCTGKILCAGFGCFPTEYAKVLDCPLIDEFTPPELKFHDPAVVYLDGYGLSRLGPARFEYDESFFQCQGGRSIPTYLVNNGEGDCTEGEDEGIPVYNLTCPGHYRCKEFGICLHNKYVCDGVHHCPWKDDELYCSLNCPQECVCEGLAFRCAQMIDPLQHIHLRYLDLSSAANVSMAKLHFLEYLAFLNLSSCRLVNASLRDMPQLRTLDLSHNLLAGLSHLSLVTLPGLTHLDLSHNPFVVFVSADFTALLRAGEMQSLQTLLLVSVNMEAIDGRLFSPLTMLRQLDVRGNPLRRYSQESLQGLVSLEELWTDESRLCCPYFLPSVLRCQAPVDELSSCSDLLGRAVFRVCLWALAALAVTGNTGVFVYRLLQARKRPSLSASTILVQNLCASDLLMGVYLTMIGAADSGLSGSYVAREGEWRGSATCRLAGVLSLLSSEVSALLVSLITLDRVLVLSWPFRSHLHLTPRGAVLCCLAAWLAGLLLALLPIASGLEFYGQTGICIPLPITRQQFSGQRYSFGLFIVFNLLIFLAIGLGQLVIYLVVRRANVAAGTANVSQDATLARRLFLVVLTDFACWFPVGMMGLLAASGTPIPGEVNVWVAIFVLPLNSALNPFLYTLNALLERLNRERERKKIRRILATLQNEIPKWTAATVQEVIRICARSAVLEKAAIARLPGRGLPDKVCPDDGMGPAED